MTEGRVMGEATRSVYLDNAATTYPKPEVVYEAVDGFMRGVGGSAGRSGHWRSVEAGRMVYAAREAVASLLGMPDPLRLVFTRNATEALNLAIQGMVKPGDHVVTTSMEHNSVMRPLAAAGKQGVSSTAVRCAPDGMLDPADVEKAITSSTGLIVLNHVSNVTGTVQPLDEVARIARAAGIPLLVDAAQSAGRIPIDVSASGIDLLAFTGHKELFGPQGTGGLYIGAAFEPEPLCYGGTGSRSSELEQPPELPERYESGTINAPGIVGLGAGAGFVRAVGVEAVRSHELGLLERLTGGLAEMRGVTVHGPTELRDRAGMVALTFADAQAPDVAADLDGRYGIAVRAGLHCAPCAHQTIGTIETGALRVSLSYMNSTGEIDYFLDCLKELRL
ncbi:MAG TPA: aminotransferase class V-fold PLP-dependent enzyme [Candidatus Anoxymicrobiaceae bacterium]